MVIKAHQKLKAWQIAMTLVKDIYRLTREFPAKEQYGLITQMQRSSVSVPANIAEGAARKSSREFRRFLLVARGSLAEVETHLLIAEELAYTEHRRVREIRKNVDRLFGLLNGLIRKHESEVAEGRGTYRLRLASSTVSRLPSTH